MTLILDDWFIAVLAIAVAILGVGRLTRVIVYDTFPPAVWLRIKWDALTEPRKPGDELKPLGLPAWNSLLHCWWCLSFWVALFCVGWWLAGMYLTWAFWAWWVFWGALSLSYISTMVIVRDTPEE